LFGEHIVAVQHFAPCDTTDQSRQVLHVHLGNRQAFGSYGELLRGQPPIVESLA
jgi:hypothetical protein